MHVNGLLLGFLARTYCSWLQGKQLCPRLTCPVDTQPKLITHNTYNLVCFSSGGQLSKSWYEKTVDLGHSQNNVYEWIHAGVFMMLSNFFGGAYLLKHLTTLTHYSPVLLFYTPWKHQKTFRFSKGIEKQHRAVMG